MSDENKNEMGPVQDATAEIEVIAHKDEIKKAGIKKVTASLTSTITIYPASMACR
jgi:hypothetical protein